MSDLFAPYAKLFEHPKGPGDARPAALQVIQDMDLANKWAGKVVLITGATSGLGLETARALFTTGADVFITARDAKKGQDAINNIVKSSEGKGKIDFIEMELNSLESVKKAAQDFLAKSGKLNILINNAGKLFASPEARLSIVVNKTSTPGIMAVQEPTKTVDGFEQQFGVNYLAHYTLTVLLFPTLLKSSTPEFNSRVISVTSAGHGFSSVRFDDTYLNDHYDPWVAYGQSKTANIWLANYIDRKYGTQGVHANAVHPGGIDTPLMRHLPKEATEAWASSSAMANNMKSPEQGAATATWAAVAEVWEGKGGKFLADCSIGHPAVNPGDIADEGFAAHAYDIDGEDRLWKLSEELTGVKL